MHKLLARQLTKAVKGSGELDLDVLLGLVSEAYDQSDSDRHRTDRSIALMVKELEQLNLGLDRLVQERTAALREREAELRAQNFRFDAAIENMPYGLSMFDRNECLTVCNERYGKMYGMDPGTTEPGVTLRSILEARMVGQKPEDARRYIERRLGQIRRGEPFYVEDVMPDGRIFAVNHRPMLDGGWVAIHQDITAQKRAESQIAYMARHDGLTSLANRAVLLEKMEEELARLRRYGSHFTVFLLDLDLFKTVNDSLGHPVGDELLKAVAGRLLGCIRETDTVARLGGDEFAILATAEGDQRDAAIATAGKILGAISAPYDLEGHNLHIGTSIGIALAPEHGTEADQLMKNADLALYKAKSEGRDAYRFFEDAMGVEVRTRRAHQIDLRNALTNEEFELYYQPIVDIQTRQTTSIEALIRWHHPQRGMVSPAEFIPLAEETGLINQIGEWVLRRACLDAVQLAVERQGQRKSVGGSVPQDRSDRPFQPGAARLRPAARAPGAGNHRVGAAAGQCRERRDAARLREMGISIVLDDFGTGYSSLSYLRMFPFDKIKIDRSFVHELAKNADCAAIVSAVAGLGRSLRIGTVAEGVETEDQLLLVHAAGCTHAQGYLFGRPCPAAELDFRRFAPRPQKIKVA